MTAFASLLARERILLKHRLLVGPHENMTGICITQSSSTSMCSILSCAVQSPLTALCRHTAPHPEGQVSVNATLCCEGGVEPNEMRCPEKHRVSPWPQRKEALPRHPDSGSLLLQHEPLPCQNPKAKLIKWNILLFIYYSTHLCALISFELSVRILCLVCGRVSLLSCVPVSGHRAESLR